MLRFLSSPDWEPSDLAMLGVETDFLTILFGFMLLLDRLRFLFWWLKFEDNEGRVGSGLIGSKWEGRMADIPMEGGCVIDSKDIIEAVLCLEVVSRWKKVIDLDQTMV